MGTLIRAWKTAPLPAGATIKKNIAHWTVKGAHFRYVIYTQRINPREVVTI